MKYELGSKVTDAQTSKVMYEVDVANVAMRFCLDHPVVATTIVGMSKQRSVEENLKAIDFTIPEGLLERINKLVALVKKNVV